MGNNRSALKGLDREVGIYHTDHTDHLSKMSCVVVFCVFVAASATVT